VSEPVLVLARQVIARHALRGADAIHLASAVYLRELLREPPVIIASDAELIAASISEGFSVIDPNLNPPLPDVN
jgi:hypothetical protein